MPATTHTITYSCRSTAIASAWKSSASIGAARFSRTEATRRSSRIRSRYFLIYLLVTPTRKWRNWQTHQLEGLAVVIPSGFKSPLPHHLQKCGDFSSLVLSSDAVLRDKLLARLVQG